jgi:exosortase/archaeosortase family protein
MASLRPLLGLLLTGYGLLVLAQVIAHESWVAGVVSLAAGLALVAGAIPHLGVRRGRLVAALGLLIVTAVGGYNVLRDSDLGVPEWALLVYGAALLAASPFLSLRLGRVEMGSLVGWSFPLVLAPMSLFALNAALSSSQTGAAASPLVVWLIVVPTVLSLRALGMDVELMGRTMLVPTDRGLLSLDVGLVCAGIYPIILFGGLVALHAWREGVSIRRGAVLVASGVLGLWLLNLLRLVVLTQVGASLGPQALQRAHANLGWVLFGLFMVGFWAVALRPRVVAHELPVAAAVRDPA